MHLCQRKGLNCFGLDNVHVNVHVSLDLLSVLLCNVHVHVHVYSVHGILLYFNAHTCNSCFHFCVTVHNVWAGNTTIYHNY